MPEKKKLVIWGGAGHALVVAEIVRLQGEYEIVGVIDNVESPRSNPGLFGVTLLGGEEQLIVLRKNGVEHLIFGIGDCQARLKLSARVRAQGFHLATAIHPRAVMAQGVQIGAGTVVAAGVVVNPGTTIGENVIINTSASIDHECVIEDGVHVSPGANLAGNVRVGRAAWIGIGATVIERVSIGAGSLIGAGAVVVRDIPDGVVAFGNPARVQRRLDVND
jgi:sugar O-acyltransferase (sialic acid O-acetyltransferase NeuD family)